MLGQTSLWACTFWLAASAATAQVVRPPARSAARPSGRTEQALTLQGNVLGGYEDNLVPPGGGDVLAQHPSGYTGFSDAALLYSIGNPMRSLEASTGGYMNTYSNIGLGAAYGGEQRLRARTNLGRRTEVAFNQDLRYAPDFSLGLFGAVQPDSGRSNTENPTNALTRGGSWTTGASGSVVRRWSRRASMDAGYTFGRVTYVHGDGFDSVNHSGSVGAAYSIGRWAGIRATYQHGNGRFEQVQGPVVPILTRSADVGYTYARRLSPSRQVSFYAGSGATHVDTVERQNGQPSRYWTPSGYGAVRVDVARSWTLGGDYRLSTTPLQGNTPEPFTAHTAQASLGGNVRPWLQSVFTVGFANGVSGAKTLERAPGTYDTYTGTVQFRLRLRGGWSSIVSLTRFHYRLNEAASQSLGVSRELNRSAVRAGLAWSLPLYSTK
jgi:hypothetical protein